MVPLRLRCSRGVNAVPMPVGRSLDRFKSRSESLNLIDRSTDVINRSFVDDVRRKFRILDDAEHLPGKVLLHAFVTCLKH